MSASHTKISVLILTRNQSFREGHMVQLYAATWCLRQPPYPRVFCLTSSNSRYGICTCNLIYLPRWCNYQVARLGIPAYDPNHEFSYLQTWVEYSIAIEEYLKFTNATAACGQTATTMAETAPPELLHKPSASMLLTFWVLGPRCYSQKSWMGLGHHTKSISIHLHVPLVLLQNTDFTPRNRKEMLD